MIPNTLRCDAEQKTQVYLSANVASNTTKPLTLARYAAQSVRS